MAMAGRWGIACGRAITQTTTQAAAIKGIAALQNGGLFIMRVFLGHCGPCQLVLCAKPGQLAGPVWQVILKMKPGWFIVGENMVSWHDVARLIETAKGNLGDCRNAAGVADRLKGQLAAAGSTERALGQVRRAESGRFALGENKTLCRVFDPSDEGSPVGPTAHTAETMGRCIGGACLCAVTHFAAKAAAFMHGVRHCSA